MSKESYINIRNTMHTYSRAPLSEGQTNIDQATIRAGHNVSIDEIRAERIPKIVSIEERNEKYLIEENGKRIVGGKLGASFNKVIKFIDGAFLKEVPNSNGESFMVVDDKDIPILNWIDPIHAPLNQHVMSEGYEIKLFAENNETEIYRNLGWDFDSFNGIVHFSSSFIPESDLWNNKNYGKPRIQGFIYIGKYVSDITNAFDQKLNNSKQLFDNAIAQCLAIQPFKFSSDIMFKLGDPYQIEYTGDNEDKRDWFQTLTFIVPGYCFELTSLDKDETILTEMRHLKNGDTQIFMNLPWDVNYGKPIIRYSYDSGMDGVGNKFPVIGTYNFIATTFVSADGSKIGVKNIVDFTKLTSSIIEIPLNYEYCEAIGPGFTSNYPVGTYSSTYPGNISTDLSSEL